MTADAPDDWLVRLARASHVRREIAQAADRQNIRERVEVLAQRSIFRHRRCKIFDRHLARSRSERIGADLIEAQGLKVFVDRHEIKKTNRLARGPALAGGQAPPLNESEQVRFNQFAQDMTDQVVRFLYALRVVAFDD